MTAPYLARDIYTGDGSTTTFNLTFEFINRSYVEVRVDDVVTAFTWITDGQIDISPAPANLSVVQIKRITESSSRLVVWSNGSILIDSDLNKSDLHLFHLAQESMDDVLSALRVDALNTYDAGTKRIRNVVDGTDPQDAATKSQVDAVSSAVSADAASAATSASNAATSEANAANSEQFVEDWASKTDGIVESTDYSSKAYAIGGTGVTDTAGRGAAKEWATKAEDSTVDGTEYSAKHYANKAADSAATNNFPSLIATDTGAIPIVNAAGTGYDKLLPDADPKYLRSNGTDTAPSWESLVVSEVLRNNGYRSGAYYNGLGTLHNGNILLFSADTIYLSPFYITETNTFDRITFQVATTGTASNARCCLYNVADGIPTTNPQIS